MRKIIDGNVYCILSICLLIIMRLGPLTNNWTNFLYILISKYCHLSNTGHKNAIYHRVQTFTHFSHLNKNSSKLAINREYASHHMYSMKKIYKNRQKIIFRQGKFNPVTKWKKNIKGKSLDYWFRRLTNNKHTMR